MHNDDLYLTLARAILDCADGKPRDEQERIVAASIRRVSEGFLQAMALDEQAPETR